MTEQQDATILIKIRRYEAERIYQLSFISFMGFGTIRTLALSFLYLNLPKFYLKEKGLKAYIVMSLKSAPDRTRTCYPQIRNLVLYPDELRGQFI